MKKAITIFSILFAICFALIGGGYIYMATYGKSVYLRKMDLVPITITQVEHATINCQSFGIVGESVKITSELDDNYDLLYYTLNGEKLDSDTFIVKETENVISAVVEYNPVWTVTINHTIVLESIDGTDAIEQIVKVDTVKVLNNNTIDLEPYAEEFLGQNVPNLDLYNNNDLVKTVTADTTYELKYFPIKKFYIEANYRISGNSSGGVSINNIVSFNINVYNFTMNRVDVDWSYVPTGYEDDTNIYRNQIMIANLFVGHYKDAILTEISSLGVKAYNASQPLIGTLLQTIPYSLRIYDVETNKTYITPVFNIERAN